MKSPEKQEDLVDSFFLLNRGLLYTIRFGRGVLVPSRFRWFVQPFGVLSEGRWPRRRK